MSDIVVRPNEDSKSVSGKVGEAGAAIDALGDTIKEVVKSEINETSIQAQKGKFEPLLQGRPPMRLKRSRIRTFQGQQKT
jgi:hypothetical protein